MLRELLRRTSEYRLFDSKGRVHDPRSFAERNAGVLAPPERAYLTSHLALLTAEKAGFPERPLCLAATPPADATPCLTDFQHVGARSVFLPKMGVFIKACRPESETGLSFPSLDVSTRTGKFVMSELPFGVLTIEGAMRELLAAMFACQHGFLRPRLPLAVIEYEAPSHGCAIVFCDSGLPRVEAILHYPAGDLSDLLAAAISDTTAGTALSPGEVGLRGVDKQWYVEAKTRRLVEWQLAGGFRRFLNSNIGNDIITGSDPATRDVAFVDFDSFCIRPLPEPSSPDECIRFMLRGSLDAVRGSLPIASLVFDGKMLQGVSSSEYGTRVLQSYETASSSWAVYRRMLTRELHASGWPEELVAQGWAKVKEAPAFRTAVSDQIVDLEAMLTSYSPEESLYVVHSNEG